MNQRTEVTGQTSVSESEDPGRHRESPLDSLEQGAKRCLGKPNL